MNAYKTFRSATRLLALPAFLLALAGTSTTARADFDTSLSLDEPAKAAAPAAKSEAIGGLAPTNLELSPKATFLISNERLTPNKEVLWPGLLTGLRGFEHFYEPVGQPIYFESPFNNTSLRLLYLHHEFSNNSQLRGGHLDVFAAQIRLALTERLALIATKDGWSKLRAGLLAADDGWNDLALGFKYVIFADKEMDLVITPGIRYQAANGDAGVLQGGSQEFSPFISAAKGFGDLHFIGDITYRIPLDTDKGNRILQWDLHADYEVFKGIAPMIELHGLHYLTNGKRFAALEVGGLDYANLGSGNVSGSHVVWMGVGARAKLTPNASIGATYEFSLTNRSADIMDKRVTVDIIFTW